MGSMGRGVAVSLLVLGTVLAGGGPVGAASPDDLPRVESGHRPGPDALYAPPPRAPQLENDGPWRAEPILVSGASAYRDGEFLYQDFLFDDHGAALAPDPADPFGPQDHLYSPKAGTLTYPSSEQYADNAADLVELRLRPVRGATALRVTLNSLADPERTAFTVALGSADSARAWPHGAGVRSPAELRDAATGAVLAPAPSAAVDETRRQFDVRIPLEAWDPGRSTVRVAAGVGLWDPDADAYAAPQPTRGEHTPGGGVPGGAALFNVAFREDEPMPDITQFGAGVTMVDAAAGAEVDGAWWRERAQADALRLGDVSRFAAEVDFGALADREDDESGVPRTGPINRILASRHVFGQGYDMKRSCGGIEAAGGVDECDGAMAGQLQPYALYVPETPQPERGYGFTFLLHSLSANYNQYSASKNQSQLGDRAAGSLVATPAGRGPDGFYTDIAEADAFEVWADVARHYDLDADWAAVSGYSMGGYGTWRFLARWPDLFARGQSTVGPRGTMEDQLASLRNTPVMAWAAGADELVNIAETEGATRQLEQLGLRFVADLFPAADHLSIATNDEYGPAAAFLGAHRVDRDPAHVTYVVDTSEDSERAGAVADHAYWISDLRLRVPTRQRGTVDVRSEGFGQAVARPTGVTRSTGLMPGGSRGPQAFVRREQGWREGTAPRRDRLVVRATNVASMTIDARRARVSCSPEIVVEQADGPVDVKVAC